MATRFEQDRLLTAEEFFDLPDDGIPYELVEGRVVPKYRDDDGTPMTGTGGQHSGVSSELLAMLREYVKPRQLGRVFGEQFGVLVRRDPDVMRAPDVTYVSWNRLPGRRVPVGWLSTAPELVAEVLSPNDRASEVMRKVREYLGAGVLLVWVADPETRVVTAYTPDGSARIHGESDTLDGGSVLPDLRIPVAPLFEFDGPPADA